MLLVAGLAVVASLRHRTASAASQGGALAFHVVTGVCVLAIAAAVVLGIAVMINK